MIHWTMDASSGPSPFSLPQKTPHLKTFLKNKGDFNKNLLIQNEIN